MEDIAVSWWKLKTVQDLLIKDLRARQKTSESVLDIFNNATSGIGVPLSSSSRELRMATDFGLECRELVLRVDGKQFDEKRKSGFMGHPEKTGHIAMEAKLGNSSETLLRYERAWKADSIAQSQL